MTWDICRLHTTVTITVNSKFNSDELARLLWSTGFIYNPSASRHPTVTFDRKNRSHSFHKCRRQTKLWLEVNKRAGSSTERAVEKAETRQLPGRRNYEGDGQRTLSVTWHGRTGHDWVFMCATVTRATINPEFVHRVASTEFRGSMVGGSNWANLLWGARHRWHFISSATSARDVNFPTRTELPLRNI